MKRSELRIRISHAIRMYDSDQQIDKHVKSSESGYDESQLDSYCESEQIKIMKEYNKSLAPSKTKRNEKLRNRYANDLNFKEKIKEKNLEAYHANAITK